MSRVCSGLLLLANAIVVLSVAIQLTCRPAVPPSPPPSVPAKRLTLYLFTMPGCTWCDRLRESMRDPRVAEVLKEFAVRDLDILSPEARRFGVHAAPTLIVTGDGAERAKVGYQSPDELASWLKGSE